jgi:nucleoid-associated protein YgaU
LKSGEFAGWPGIAAATTFVVVGAAVIHFGWVGPTPQARNETTTAASPNVAALNAQPTAQSIAAPETASAASEPQSSAMPPLPEPPRFDVVRIEQDGSTLVAGAGAPDWPVAVLLDGHEVDRPTIGSDGRFVTFLELMPSDAPRVMTLVMHGPKGEGDVTSTEQVILAPSTAVIAEAQPDVSQQNEEVADVTSSGTADDDTPVVVEIAQTLTQGTAATDQNITGSPVLPEAPAKSGDAPQTEAAPAQADDTALVSAPTAEAGASEQTTTVLLADGNGVRVLQGGAPEVAGTVLLDTISYDTAGEVVLSGRGTPGAYVRIYLDDLTNATAQIAQDGSWGTTLPEVDTGVYRLRVDEVDGAGAVVSRVETPFKRADQELAAELNDGLVSQVTVQPGSTLWAIARQNYGAGVLYVRVFEANRALIRDPDLIYPGQIFTVPEPD